MYFSTRQDFIGTRYVYTVYIYIYDIRAGDPCKFNFNPSYFTFTNIRYDIVDFIFIKHELVVLACLQFWPIKKVQYFTTITKER